MKASTAWIALVFAGRSLLRRASAPRKWPRMVMAWLGFWSSVDRYNELATPGERARGWSLFPCVDDASAETPIEPIYFYQDAWAFEQIVKARPASHVDVGSHHKFVALLSKVVPLTMVDLRPLSLPMDTIRFETGSIVSLPFPKDSLPSLSSLCVVEHIGLGRYGDSLDPNGSIKALEELIRVLAPGGDLYLSVPVAEQASTEFNAHRIFAERALLALLSRSTKLVQARYIVGMRFVQERGSQFAIGCYHLRKSAG